MDSYRRNELPQAYSRCKAYTDGFSDWLIETAVKRGIEVASKQEDDRSKTAKKKGQHKVNIHDIVPLAEQIVASGIPLQEEDRVGLNDLRDAISTRKEVTSWFRYHSQSDKEHPFFISKLIHASKILTTFWRSEAKEHDLPSSGAKSKTVILVQVDDEQEDEEDSEDTGSNDEDESKVPEHPTFTRRNKKPSSPSSKTQKDAVLSTEEILLENEFLVLCFFYDLRQTRQLIKRVWYDYKDRKIELITAAITTDAAFGLIKRNVSALMEDIRKTSDKRSIVDIAKALFEAIPTTTEMSDQDKDAAPSAESNASASEDDADLLLVWIQHLCISAFDQWEKYQHLIGLNTKAALTPVFRPGHEVVAFLLFFKQLHAKKVMPPILDNFTRDMLSDSANPWLPFGVQVMMDIHQVLREDMFDVFPEVSDECMRVCKLLKDHCEYEDQMWSAGIKPDYLTVGETKFSNIFLRPASDMVNWLSQISADDDVEQDEDILVAGDFVSFHPVLSGLVLFHFNKLYQSQSIAKIEWFVVAICHLYNACRQIGELSSPWPDLEYIIEMHGSNRIFVGSRPEKGADLVKRFSISVGTSTRYHTSEYITRSKDGAYLRMRKEPKQKRGLQRVFPLQKEIRDYYYNYAKQKRWMRLHNLWSYIHKSINFSEPAPGSEIISEIHADFEALVTSWDMKKRPTGDGKNFNVKPPNLKEWDDVYVRLLDNLKTMQQEQELHSKFDYLSWYRRAFAFVQHIRGDILYDSSMELARLDSEEPPSNIMLLFNLLGDLKPKYKSKKAKALDNEVSKDVLATEQLKKVSAILQELIQEEGRYDLNNAERLMRSWEKDDTKESDPSACAESDCYPRRPDGIFHTFTFYATSPRRRRIAFVRASSPRRAFLQSRCVTVFKHRYFRLAMKKKRRIGFRCFGNCCLARHCLNRDAKKSEDISKQQANMSSVGSGDSPDMRGEWGTNTDPSDAEWEDAVEIQEDKDEQ